MIPLIEARKISLNYGAVGVLHDISFTIGSGEFVALVGPNGAGKTTLLETLAGVRRPSSGAALLDGESLAQMAPRRRARSCALLGREAAGATTLCVESVVELGRLPYLQGISLSSNDRLIVARALHEQDCFHLKDRSLYSLSDGERQRVQWARALCQEPRALLLDEATAHLDLAHREAMFSRARRFAQADNCVLAVAHDLDLAARHATRVVVLYQGRIVADDEPIRALRPAILARVFGVDAAIVKDGRGSALFVYGET